MTSARIAAVALVAVLASALTGCVVYSSQAGENVVVNLGDTAGPAPETLRAARFENGALVVRVASNGCTEASDFDVAIADGVPTELTLTRREADVCEALVVEGVELRWTYAELGLSEGGTARVTNPVTL